MTCNTDSCTLIYQLARDEEGVSHLTFDQLYLIVRSLHTYKVKDIVKDTDSQTIKVFLNYNASMKNVRTKLGNVPALVCKQNPLIETRELSELESLRAAFGFGGPIEEEECETSKPAKKRCYKKVS